MNEELKFLFYLHLINLNNNPIWLMAIALDVLETNIKTDLIFKETLKDSVISQTKFWMLIWHICMV